MLSDFNFSKQHKRKVAFWDFAVLLRVSQVSISKIFFRPTGVVLASLYQKLAQQSHQEDEKQFGKWLFFLILLCHAAAFISTVVKLSKHS